jgi:hypothetical protein
MIDRLAARKLFQDTTNQETVTFWPKITETTFANPGYTLYRATRSRLMKQVNAGGRMLLKQRTVWRLWINDLFQAANGRTSPTPIPKVKDKITDFQGVDYIIIENVQILYRGQCFVCETQEATDTTGTTPQPP